MNLAAFLLIYFCFLLVAKICFIALNFVFDQNIQFGVVIYIWCLIIALNAWGVFDK